MSIVENIKSLCDSRDLSIPKLEKELGFGRGSIYNWDTSSPSIDKVTKVAEFFKVSINRILYGFDANEFSNLTNIAKGDRSIVQFSNDTGVDHNEIIRICLGFEYERPSYDTVKKIAAKNQHTWLFDEDRFLVAAGYTSARQWDVIRSRTTNELVEAFEKDGFEIDFEKDEEFFRKVRIVHEDGKVLKIMPLNDFLLHGFDLLQELKDQFSYGTPGNEAPIENSQFSAFFKDFSSAPEERKEELIRFWNYIQEAEKGRKPGDRQGE